MALFQTSVLKKYLKQQDKAAVDKAYKAYTKYFLHPTIQENIRNSKEEQFQATFLNELFVKILGYTINPSPKFNLTTEFKNQTGAKKADGAILNNDDKAIAVIELKGTNTKELESIRQQAFDYKANQSSCVYVVTSNFEKLRFYIHNAVEHIEFNLFMLSPDRFALLYLCLHKEHILSGLPEKIKNDSVVAEEDITKKFYADYSVFKRELFRDLVKLNLKNEVFRTELTREDAERGQKNIKLTLFKKSQKLIDRFLFIFFAEDRGLLPPNSITLIINEYNQLQEMDRAEPLYDTYKLYFKYLDQGRAGTDKKAEIFAYNGGLFKPDAVLDSLLISDDLLLRHTSKLTKYDFESQVDVNILGHIFENSLNEIESVNAEIEGTDFDKQKTKRKKDGVFYTPKYITKYIVDNTVGKLCEEKKAELKLEDEEYHKGRKNRQKKTLEDLLAKLDTYREWLLSLTICDPACGSGAFLNQALDFLIKEHTYVDELKQALLGGALVLSDIENTILERNIYGVDLNEESVEIAKLSLWLRTAQPRRKLNSLNNNIKCGNSLIDSKAVAGDKAFHWETEFPEVFKKGTSTDEASAKSGFDVVIGNPPYVNLESVKEISESLSKMNYKTYSKRGDLYCLFIEKGFNLLKPKGAYSYIMPNKWLQAGYGESVRELFLEKNLEELIDFGDLQIFQGATTYPCIFIARNEVQNDTFDVSVLKQTNEFDFETIVKRSQQEFQTKDFTKDTWVVSSAENKALLTRLSSLKTLSQFINGGANYGIKFGLTEAFLINDEKVKELVSEDENAAELIGKILRGRDLKSYGTPGKEELDSLILAYFNSYELIKKNYPSIYNHLLPFEEKLKKRGQCNGSKITDDKPFTGQHHWLELDNNPSLDYLGIYKQPKIMYQTFQVKPCFIYDETGLFCNNSMWIIPTNNKALLGVLNSKMGWWLITKYCTQIQNGCQLIWKYFGQIPIPQLTNPNLTIAVENMISVTSSVDKISSAFLAFLQSKFGVEKWSNKMEKWYELEFGEFIKELNKAIKKEGGTTLTKLQEMEWMEVFETKKAEAQALQAEIDQTDREIDAMVYELYGLTEEEIGIVENS